MVALVIAERLTFLIVHIIVIAFEALFVVGEVKALDQNVQRSMK